MNVIYDKDPISQWVFGRVALMGEAAHPTTPHGSRRWASHTPADAAHMLQCASRTAFVCSMLAVVILLCSIVLLASASLCGQPKQGQLVHIGAAMLTSAESSKCRLRVDDVSWSLPVNTALTRDSDYRLACQIYASTALRLLTEYRDAVCCSHHCSMTTPNDPKVAPLHHRHCI